MKFLSYILSPIFGVVFFLLLLIFHPIQWLTLKIDQKYQQRAVELLNFCIVKSFLILGVSVRFKNEHELPVNKTLIFVANHQSLYDIPPLIWYLRKHQPRFVSKIELKKGIPSISINLKEGGACLIDRKDRNQAIKALNDFGKRINQKKWSAIIFPEGTRSRNGVPKPFSYGGLKTIISHNPDTLVVPISINNSWKFFKYGKFPLGIFSTMTFDVHESIAVKNQDINIVLKQAEEKVKSKIIVSNS